MARPFTAEWIYGQMHNSKESGCPDYTDANLVNKAAIPRRIKPLMVRIRCYQTGTICQMEYLDAIKIVKSGNGEFL